MIDVTVSLLAGAWAHRDWVLLFVAGVLFFLWRMAEFDARTLNKLLDMRAEDHAAEVADLRRRLYLREASKWARR